MRAVEEEREERQKRDVERKQHRGREHQMKGERKGAANERGQGTVRKKAVQHAGARTENEKQKGGHWRMASWEKGSSIM